MTGAGGPGSGYALGGRLVLTSAHVVTVPRQERVAPLGRRVQVFHPGGDRALDGGVVWCGTSGGRDDAALVLVDDNPGWSAPVAPVRWGRLVTDRPGAECETWGLPDLAQHKSLAAEAVQLRGRLNPGSGITHNQYVMDLLQHPPQWSAPGTSPWGGLSGAAVCCDRLLVGVVASDRAHSGHGQLNTVPAYVLHHDAAFRAALATHGGSLSGPDAVELQHLNDPATGPRDSGPVRSPAALLPAARQTVPFHGRRQLLEELTAWCARGGFGAWLLHGPGGQGKTRLGHHLASLLTADRWVVLWPRPDATADQLRQIRDVSKPLLVVLDYAETRTEQLAALVEAAADHPGTAPFKVLLLARTDGDWWRQAATAGSLAQDYLDAAPTHLLAPLEGDPAARPDAYRAAVHALASALGQVKGLASYDWPGIANNLPLPVRLHEEVYGNALTLHMTALADLLDTTAPGHVDLPWSGPGRAVGDTAREEAEGVEDRLLGHERRYWHQSAAARGLTPGLSTATLETALAAAHLAGAADRDEADVLWRRLPALADQPRDRRDTVTAWIASLYPAVAPLPWGTLQPDRIAERHVGRSLDANPALADQLLDGADDAQANQLLTVYSRAAAHPVFDHRMDDRLTALCTRRSQQLAAAVIATATRTDHPAPLTAALDTITTDPATTLNDLITLYKHFPLSSQRLARTAVRLAHTLTGHYRALAQTDPDTYLRHLAGSLNNLSAQLGEIGQREQALAAIREAVGHYRALAQADPDSHLHHLAGSLNTLSTSLGALGQRQEGLAAIQEAVGHYRALAQTDPDTHLPHLAASLNTLSASLGAMGQREEALTAVQEAVGHYRALARTDPDPHLPHLAMSLNNLSASLGALGQRQDGLAAIREAVGHYRALAQANPDAHLPHFAASLNTLAAHLGDTGWREEALAAIREATGHYRALAQINPDAHLHHLALSLNTLSASLGAVGQREEALAASREAVDHHRALAQASPDAHLPGLAMSL
ncbi:P-loop NTPase, partial [Streptomyces sp. NPDC001443]